MKENWLWLLFEIAINFYQGFLVTYFIDLVHPPAYHRGGSLPVA